MINSVDTYFLNIPSKEEEERIIRFFKDNLNVDIYTLPEYAAAIGDREHMNTLNVYITELTYEIATGKKSREDYFMSNKVLVYFQDDPSIDWTFSVRQNVVFLFDKEKKLWNACLTEEEFNEHSQNYDE